MERCVILMIHRVDVGSPAYTPPVTCKGRLYYVSESPERSLKLIIIILSLDKQEGIEVLPQSLYRSLHNTSPTNAIQCSVHSSSVEILNIKPDPTETLETILTLYRYYMFSTNKTYTTPSTQASVSGGRTKNPSLLIFRNWNS